MVKKIALEEHFLPPGLAEYWMPTVADIDPGVATRLYSRLNDFGDQRLAAMDGGGIDRAVLSVAGPGVQHEHDTNVATRRAREANDFLAREIYKRPERYAGFAHLALQDPRGAAAELDRCVHELGFFGAMINGHTNGRYLDAQAFDPFWERAADLGVPVYLHPADPVVPAPVLDGMPALRRGTWEWTFETGSHALRLVFGGVFDRFPNLRVVLGHMGETLPFMLKRFDSRSQLYGVNLGKPVSQYIRDNFFVTISGLFATEPLYCAIAALGGDRVMFAADYPFENMGEAGKFIDNVRLDEGLRLDIAHRNAENLLGM